MAAALEDTFIGQRSAFAAQPYPSATQRRAWMTLLERVLLDHADAICESISADFGHRSAFETRMVELVPSVFALRYAHRHVTQWMKPQRRSVSIWFQPGRAEVLYQPLGVVGIIVPWNYPLYLTIGPLAAALAAGNRVMLKLSEHTPQFSDLFARIIEKTFQSDLIRVVNGDQRVGRAFTALPFDHLLFTGSGVVARDVLSSAARHLTPVTLELGGKSPALITPSFDLSRAARQIIFGKLINAGQTCVAPDYVLAPQGALPAFTEALRKEARLMYGVRTAEDYTSIVNARQYSRLERLLQDAQQLGARTVPLLDSVPNGSSRYFPPLLLLDPTRDMQIMHEEIFGPILPIIGYTSLDAAIGYINAHARPLALYLFDDDERRRGALLTQVSSGGVTINDTMLHVVQDDLPFGGVGASGMGRYHAVEGFRTFSQARSVFRQSRFSMTSLMYPPYGGRLAGRILELMLRTGRL